MTVSIGTAALRKAWRQITRASERPFTRAATIGLRELVKHSARHAADIGEREIAEDRGGQDHAGHGVPERVRLTLHQRIEEHAARYVGEVVRVGDVDPSWPSTQPSLA